VTAYIRMLVRLARPSALIIFAMFAATGMAEAGAFESGARLTCVLVVVTAYLLYSVVLNDVSDRAIDEVNLAGDAGRPLVGGDASAHDFHVIAATSGAIAVGAGALLSVETAAIVAAGLLFSAAYSLRPMRIADRGAVASMLLPLGYVAVPYLVGISSIRSSFGARDLLLGAGLYLGFVGRILLKDFRDVRGDALFGKRTFLVRHGRRWTCIFSASCWVAGTVTLAAVPDGTTSLAAAYAVFVAAALVLLRALAHDRGPRRDERLISAIAIVGRATIATLIGHLSMTSAGWFTRAEAVVVAVFAVVSVGQAIVMACQGPLPGRTRALSAGACSGVDVDDHSTDRAPLGEVGEGVGHRVERDGATHRRPVPALGDQRDEPGVGLLGDPAHLVTRVAAERHADQGVVEEVEVRVVGDEPACVPA
jgi:4-hydroxybenzoate polyprenyltransferase